MPAKGGGPTEREFQRVITDALDHTAWKWTHVYPLRTAHGWRTGTTWRGWPDLTALRGPYLLAIEIKTDAGRADPEQIDCLTRFSVVAGARAWVLRPRDDIAQIVGWMRDPATAPRVYGFVPNV